MFKPIPYSVPVLVFAWVFELYLRKPYSVSGIAFALTDEVKPVGGPG